MGWIIRLVGWGICIASAFFAAGSRSEREYVIPFSYCFAILVGVSVAYFLARQFSESWKSKVVRSHFTPYIGGATAYLLFCILVKGFYILVAVFRMATEPF